MLIVCAIYYSVIPNSCTGFGNWICVAPKAFLNLLNFSMFFFSLFPGVEMGGMLTPSAVTKSTRTLSDALWEPHISILSHFIWHFNFYCAARVREAKSKTKKNRCNFSTAAMSSSHLWFRLISWCDGIYAAALQRLGLSFLWRNPAGRTMWSEVKTVSNGSLYFHPVDIGQIFESIVIG